MSLLLQQLGIEPAPPVPESKRKPLSAINDTRLSHYQLTALGEDAQFFPQGPAWLIHSILKGRTVPRFVIMDTVSQHFGRALAEKTLGRLRDDGMIEAVRG